jgi:DNA-binding transcriptional MerR regulator
MAARAAKTIYAKASFAGKGSMSAHATLSVGELAEKIVPSGTDSASVRERIRHWTREGLLLPTGDRNPGVGRHRRYEAAAAIDAAVLNAIADQGIQLVGRDLLLALGQARLAESNWQAKIAKGIHYFLQIAVIRDRSKYRRVAEVYEGKVPQLPDAEVAIIVNLTHIFARLQSRLTA